MTYKQFKTKIRTLIGYVHVGEFVENSIECNSEKSWNKLFSNSKFLKSYVGVERLKFYEELVQEISKRIDLQRISIIDIGCGTGHLLKLLAERFPNTKLMGVDFADEGVRVAQTLVPCAEFYRNDIYNMEIKWKESFDLVICTEVLEHLLYPEKAFKNLLSYVKPKGYLILCVPNGRTDTYGGHIHFWSPESWTIFINQCIEKENCKCSYEIVMIENGNTNLAILTK